MRLICSLLLLVTLAVPAYADEGGMAPTVLPPGDTINVAPDAPQIVKLDQEAASVIVGSPKFASVTLDNPNTLLIIPRAPGATSLTVLDRKGTIIMERRLIVGAPADKYVRIRRACRTAGCQSSELFYCPDGCHTVGLNGSDQAPQAGAEMSVQNVNLPPAIPPLDPAALETIEKPE